MSDPVIIHKNRTNRIPVSLGVDVSDDELSSEIRTESGTLIATFLLEFDGDGSDGELLLTLDDSDTGVTIEYTTGLMDIKRVSAGEPLAVFDRPLEVEFRETITV